MDGNRPDGSLCVFGSGENRSKDRRGAPAAPRRGARQVPQQQVTTKHRHKLFPRLVVSELCFYESDDEFYLCSNIGLN